MSMEFALQFLNKGISTDSTVTNQIDSDLETSNTMEYSLEFFNKRKKLSNPDTNHLNIEEEVDQDNNQRSYRKVSPYTINKDTNSSFQIRPDVVPSVNDIAEEKEEEESDVSSVKDINVFPSASAPPPYDSIQKEQFKEDYDRRQLEQYLRTKEERLRKEEEAKKLFTKVDDIPSEFTRYYKAIRDSIKEGQFGALSNMDRKTDGISTSVAAATLSALVTLFNETPRAIADVTEAGLVALDGLFRYGLGKSISDPETGEIKIPFSKKTEKIIAKSPFYKWLGLTNIGTPEEAGEAFVNTLAFLLVGSEKEPAFFETIPGYALATKTPKSFLSKLDRKVQRQLKKDSEFTKKITNIFRSADKQFRGLPPASVVKIRMADELQKKYNVAKVIGDNNPKIKNELIEKFEESLALNKGLNRTDKDFVTISKVDKNGNRQIDDAKSVAIGKETMEQFMAQAPVVVNDIDTDLLVSPILNPDKLNALVSYVKEVQKKDGIKFNPNKTVIRNLEELTIEGKIGGQEMLDDLNKYGLGFEDFVLTVVGSGSDAGKTLQKLSQIRKATKTLGEKQFARDKKFLEQQSIVYNNLMRIENIRRGGLVSQIATATRNLTSAGMLSSMDTVVNMADNVLFKYVDDINKSNGIVDKTLKTVLPINVGKELINPFSSSWKTSFKQLDLMFNDPQRSVEIAKLILDRPEFASKNERLFLRLNEIQNANRGLATTRGGKFIDNTLSEFEDLVNVLNIPNRFQEHVIRSTYLIADLERIIKREWNVDFLKQLENGKLLDIINDSSEFRPEGARSFGFIMEDAMKNALDVTFGSKPDSPALAAVSNFIVRSGGTVVLPFPNFMFKAMERIAAYTPGTALVKTSAIPGMSPTKNPMYSLLKDILYKDSKDFGTAERRLMGNNLVGLAALYGAYEFRKSEGAPADYKMISLEENYETDASPLYPLRQLTFMGQVAEKFEEGEGLSFLERIGQAGSYFAEEFRTGEVSRTFLGSNLRVGSGNQIVDGLANVINEGVKGGKTAEAIGELAGNYVATFFVPYNQILELERVAGLRPAEVVSRRDEPVIGALENLKKGFTSKFKKLESPELEKAREFKIDVLREDGIIKRKSSLVSVITGLKQQTAPSEEGEYLIDLGFQSYRIPTLTDSEKARQAESKFLVEHIHGFLVPILMNMESDLKKNNVKPLEVRTRLQQRANTFLRSLKDAFKPQREFESGPLYSAVSQFKKLSIPSRRIAIEQYKRENEKSAIDFSDVKIVRELVAIAKEQDKQERKIQSLIKN